MKRLIAMNFALTILASAFLLFQVQPIISRVILPWFGGSPAVWSTCMVFFQTVLFAGYAYAHLSEKLARPRVQMLVHLGLIAAALAMLPIMPDPSWKPAAGESPTWRILCLLAATVGLPYFVLSSTGPLVQAWFSRAFPGRSPYRLYALSNLGSLVALLSYPFAVEPMFDLGDQAGWWAAGFVLFAGLCVVGALAAGAAKPQAEVASGVSDESTAAPNWSDQLLWLVLPGFASLMLLATTNHVCQDVAVMPFLWVVPLSLYLLTFIIAFDHERWYWRRAYAIGALALLVAIAAMDQLITTGSSISFSFVEEVTLYFAALFAICMVCHGELVRLKPHPRHLTAFYLMISAGGALGGLFVSLVAPVVFTSFFEWKLGLVGGCVIAAVVAMAAGGQMTAGRRRRLALFAPVLLAVFIGANCAPGLRNGSTPLDVHTRTFYGTANVSERDADDPSQHKFLIYSGRIVHGMQFVALELRSRPTVYYGTSSGVGRMFERLQNRPNARIGAIGLGAGTVAAYVQPGQSLRFYEINPQMLRLAETYFTFLKDCRGKCDVVLGDGRLSLERESSQQFDLLVLDAFSGDAIPSHLLTREAMDIYLKHLSPTGEIAFHVSNRYLDLKPVVARLAEHAGFDWLHISSPGVPEHGVFPAEWIVVTRNAETLSALRPYTKAGQTVNSHVPLWTDSHSNLLEILK